MSKETIYLILRNNKLYSWVHRVENLKIIYKSGDRILVTNSRRFSRQEMTYHIRGDEKEMTYDQLCGAADKAKEMLARLNASIKAKL